MCVENDPPSRTVACFFVARASTRHAAATLPRSGPGKTRYAVTDGDAGASRASSRDVDEIPRVVVQLD